MKLARLRHLANVEPYWHVQAAILAAIVLQVALNNQLTVGPKYIIAGLELLLLVALAAVSKHEHRAVVRLRRSMAIVLVALISVANVASLALVINALVSRQQITGQELLISALAIYVTNIIVFGLWYWELDGNGSQSESVDAPPIDFLFPQMSAGQSMPELAHWNPTFLDYLYVSVTNASAFSPTDTMPLTHRAKMLMTLQSTISLITVVLVIARASNILT